MTKIDRRRKLTAEQVEQIRKLRPGRTFKSIAEEYRISIGYVFKIIDGSAWKK